MGLFSFRKKIEHRRFDYQPRYYDADKEELEKRMKMYKREGTNVDLAKQRITGGFSRNYRSNSHIAGQARRKSNRILMMTLLVLLLISFIFINKYLPQIVSMIE